LREQRPDMALVQVGLPSANLLPGATDLRGQTTFRGAAAVIKGADLFIGTDGGLMHAARATNAPSVILWGGVNMPEFLGYPDHHTVICHRVSCAPCGQKGWCNNGHICMRGISAEETLAAALTQLQPARVNEIEESK
jgi:ADP-heptose:LPS heptosyltransferase